MFPRDNFLILQHPPPVCVGGQCGLQACASPSFVLSRAGARRPQAGVRLTPCLWWCPKLHRVQRSRKKKCEISHPSRMENFRMLENMGTADGWGNGSEWFFGLPVYQKHFIHSFTKKEKEKEMKTYKKEKKKQLLIYILTSRTTSIIL